MKSSPSTRKGRQSSGVPGTFLHRSGPAEDEFTIPGFDQDAITFRELESRLGRIGAIEVIRTLRDLGVLEMSVRKQPEEEAQSPPEPNSKELADFLTDDETEEFDSDPDHSSGEEPLTEEPHPMVDEGGSADELGESSERPRRAMRAVITPAETTLVPGVLSDIRSRFRDID